MLVTRDFQVEEVTDPDILNLFKGVGLTEVPITTFPQCKDNAKVNFKAFVKTFDEQPQGPSVNNTYWRTFELSDTSGNIVKGTAWGTMALSTWTKNASAELFNVTIKKKDERVSLEEDAVMLFHNKYEFCPSAPKFFKLLNWNAAAGSRV